MTEERPLDPRSASEDAMAAVPEASAPSEEPASDAPTPTPDSDSATAALMALSSAAAPTSVESASAEEIPAAPPSPEDAHRDPYPAPTGAPVTVAPVATSASAQTPPPPPSPQTPPAGAPVTPPTASKPKRKIWPWIVAGSLLVALLLGGLVFACTSTMVDLATRSLEHRYDRSDIYNYDAQDGLLNYYFEGGQATFDDVLAAFNVTAGDPAGFDHGRGAYVVDSTEGIAPGLYYLAGTQTGVSNFYVLDGDERKNGTFYTMETSVEYFGNYYTELEEGDCIVYVPQSEYDTFHLASNEPMAVNIPYQSGCYRVGIDIPAGTYTITANAEEARTTDSEAGAYVMKDLEFDEDSITEYALVIKGGRQTITVKDGDYLELFAAIATPSDGTGRTERSVEEPQRARPLYGHYDEQGRSYGA